VIPVIATLQTCFCSDNSEACKWPRDATLKLISLVGEHENQFNNSIRKQVSVTDQYNAALQNVKICKD